MKHLTSQVSPAPAPTSPGESVAAPAEVGQVMGTPTLEQFVLWLEKKAHGASCVIAATEPGFSWSMDVCMEHGLVIDQCQSAIQLVMQFQQEQGV